MLPIQDVNPLVIIDEGDKIPAAIGTGRAVFFPRQRKFSKSMIEPTTFKALTCPCLQLPVDLSRLSWIMTTNSVAGIPAPLLDRCQVVHIPDPTLDHLRMIAAGRSAGRVVESDLWRDLLHIIGTVVDRRHAAGSGRR